MSVLLMWVLLSRIFWFCAVKQLRERQSVELLQSSWRSLVAILGAGDGLNTGSEGGGQCGQITKVIVIHNEDGWCNHRETEEETPDDLSFYSECLAPNKSVLQCSSNSTVVWLCCKVYSFSAQTRVVLDDFIPLLEFLFSLRPSVSWIDFSAG